MQEITDVNLPQCQCTGCSSEEHRDPGRCKASANEPGTILCTACQIARDKDATAA